MLVPQNNSKVLLQLATLQVVAKFMNYFVALTFPIKFKRNYLQYAFLFWTGATFVTLNFLFFILIFYRG